MSEEKKEYEMKPGQISVFVNQKRTNDKQPLMWGKAKINLQELEAAADGDGNVELRVSLWGYEAQKGGNYWAGTLQLPQAGQQQSSSLPPTSSVITEDAPATEGAPDDDLPF